MIITPIGKYFGRQAVMLDRLRHSVDSWGSSEEVSPPSATATAETGTEIIESVQDVIDSMEELELMVRDDEFQSAASLSNHYFASLYLSMQGLRGHMDNLRRACQRYNIALSANLNIRRGTAGHNHKQVTHYFSMLGKTLDVNTLEHYQADLKAKEEALMTSIRRRVHNFPSLDDGTPPASSRLYRTLVDYLDTRLSAREFGKVRSALEATTNRYRTLLLEWAESPTPKTRP